MRTVAPALTHHAVPAAAGWVGALLVDRAVRRRAPGARIALQAGGLVAAAAVYPLARLGAGDDRPGVAVGGVAAGNATAPSGDSPPPGGERRSMPSGHAAREGAALAVLGAASVLAAHRSGPVGRRLLAAGWVAHAVFDAAHETGPGPRIPGWYPALCVGYDGGTAAQLLRS